MSFFPVGNVLSQPCKDRVDRLLPEFLRSSDCIGKLLTRHKSGHRPAHKLVARKSCSQLSVF